MKKERRNQKMERKNERLVFDGFHKVTVFETEIKGQIVTREKLHFKSAVAGIVIDETNRLGLVCQYRPTVGRKTWEVPAGVMDKEGLGTKETLIEELLEECEISAEDILSVSEQPVHQYFMMTGSGDATMSLYDIRVKKQENKQVQDVEVECVEWVDQATMKHYIEEGKIADGKTLLAYYYWLHKEIKEGK